MKETNEGHFHANLRFKCLNLMRFLNIAIILRILLDFSKYFIQFLEISWDFGILGFSKILGFFQRCFGTFDEVYEDFQSNLPLGVNVAV